MPLLPGTPAGLRALDFAPLLAEWGYGSLEEGTWRMRIYAPRVVADRMMSRSAYRPHRVET